jgi:hypothetical protein
MGDESRTGALSASNLVVVSSEVLQRIGAHRFVPFVVERAEIEGSEIRLWLTLTYRRATPVCCGEPGCYIPFLGRRRADVPETLGWALGLPDIPRVTMSVSLVHEPGYSHTSLGSAEDGTIVFDAAHFSR